MESRMTSSDFYGKLILQMKWIVLHFGEIALIKTLRKALRKNGKWLIYCVAFLKITNTLLLEWSMEENNIMMVNLL